MAQFSRIQRGSVNIPGSSTTVDVSISAVDSSKCLVFHSARPTVNPTNINLQQTVGVYHTFVNSTTIRFGRRSNVDGVSTQIPVVVEYQIVEFSSGVKVQRASDFTTALGATTISLTSAVDINKSWVRVYETGQGPNWSYNGYDQPIYKLKNTSAFDVSNWRDVNNFNTNYFWEVVEYDNCKVQYLSANLPSGFGTNTLGLIGNLTSAVDPSKTFVFGNTLVRTGYCNTAQIPILQLSGNDKVVWKRYNAVSRTDNIDICVYVVEFSDAKIYTHSASMNNISAFSQDISSDGFDYNKSVSFLSTTYNKVSVGGESYPYNWLNHLVTHKINSNGVFSANRSSSAENVEFDYQVLEFGTSSTLTVNISANPIVICSGTSASLSWDVNPSSYKVYINDTSASSTGTSAVYPSSTTEYVISVYDTSGITLLTKSSVVVFVNYAPNVTITSSQINAYGENVTLNWDVTNPDCWCSANYITSGGTYTTSAIVYTSAWSNFDREYRTEIDINTSQLSGSSTGFPLYYDLRNLSGVSNFWNNVGTSGGDLIVATTADVQLPLEVVWISASTSAGEIYFKTDNQLSATNKFYLYWGKSGATQPAVTDTYGRNAVWSNGYKRVWHFQGGVNGVASLVDSTGSVSALVPNVNSTFMSDCPIHGEAFSATTNNYANAYQTTGIKTSDLSAAATIECLIKHASTFTNGATERRHIISHQIGLDWAFFFDTNGRLWFEQDNTAGGWSVIDSNKSSWTGGEWYDIGFTLVSTASNNHNATFYVNGVQDSTRVSTDQWLSLSNNYAIGNHGAGGAAILDNMAIGELRISNVRRDAAWMKTSNNMIMRNSSFWQTSTTQTRTTSAIEIISGTGSSWSIDRQYRLAITASNVTSAETNVPMYYSLSNLSANNAFWLNVGTSGGDLLITLSDGSTRVPLEVVYLNTSNKTGEIYFKDPGPLKTSQSNIYYIYFGKVGATQPSVSDTYGRNNVWNSNYMAVYHLHGLAESTGKASVLTAANSPVSANSYYDLNGSNQYLSFNGVSFSNLSNFTFENYIRIDGTGNNPGTVLRARNSGEGIPATGPGIRDFNELQYHWNDQPTTYDYDPNKKLPTNQWFFYGIRVDSSGAIFRISGTDTTNTTTHNNISCTTAVEWRIGDDPTFNRFFKGYIGEVRIMSATVSEGWTTIQEKMFSANDIFWSSPTFIETNSTSGGISDISFSACNNSTFRVYNNSTSALVTSAKSYNFDRRYRVKITLDRNEVFTQESNYPLTFNLARLSGATSGSILLNPFWTNVQSDGGDLLVTDINNNRLPLEIGYIDITNKKGTIYFKNINALKTSADISDNEFYLYWGKTGTSSISQPNASATYGSRNVWDNNYIGVWHLDEISGTSVNDSTQYTNNGSVTGSITTVNSPVGRGLRINSSNYVSVPSQAEFNISAFTLEFLFKTSSVVNDYPVLIVLGDSMSARAFHISVQNGGLSYYGMNNDPVIEAPSGSHSNNIWYGGAVRAQLNSSATLYVNTSAIGSDSNISTMNGNGKTLNIGAPYSTAVFELDEIRFSNIRRSEEWVKTTNNLLSDNGSVWSVGNPELVQLSGTSVVTPTSATTYTIEVINCCGTFANNVLVIVSTSGSPRFYFRGVWEGVEKGVMIGVY